FSSRRRHTRSKRDWSSDVCSSDLWKNRMEEQYLLDYFRGKQDIRLKEKQVRPEINNKVMVNRANEIVTFKTAYLLGEPVQYVSRSEERRVGKECRAGWALDWGRKD